MLSRRLQAIAERVSQGCVLVDVGTDHGRLPVSMLLSGRIVRAIAVDKRTKPLSSAQRLAEQSGLGPPKFEARLSDGLDKISFGEADCLVIAGMGGWTIHSILAAAPDKSRSFSQLLLQPNGMAASLRRELWSTGWGITAEDLLWENDQPCLIIEARYGQGICSGSEKDCWLGAMLPVRREDSWLRWLEEEHQTHENVIQRSQGRCDARYHRQFAWLKEARKSSG